MAEEIAKEVKAQEQAKNDVAARVAQLVALADGARSSGNPIDLDAVRQLLGGEAMLDAVVGMMEASLRGELDVQQQQSMSIALVAALAQQQLIENQKAEGVITQDQADKMSAKIVEDIKAATPAKVEEPKVEAPAEVKAEAPVAEAKPVESRVDQMAEMRERLAAEAGRPHLDQLAAKRAERAKADSSLGLGAA